MNRYQKGNLYELIHATTLAGISKIKLWDLMRDAKSSSY